jgi:hypothetical protein
MLYGDLKEVTDEAGTVHKGIRVRVPNPPKSAIVRLPTNAEMSARLGKQRSVRRNLGRRKSQTETVPNFKADQVLFEAIRLDAGVEFGEEEAAMVMGRLTACSVLDAERAGDHYRITLETPFGNTVHELRIPFQPEVHAYRSTILTVTDLPHGQEEIRFRSASAVTLYTAVAVSIEGYVEGMTPADVPPHHMAAVAAELVTGLEDLDPLIDPN